MSTRTSSLSMRTTSPSTMSPSLKSMRTDSSMGTISPFSSLKKSFIVSARVAFSVVLAINRCFPYLRWLPERLYKIFVRTFSLVYLPCRRGIPHPPPTLPDLHLDLQGRVEVVGCHHPLGR